MANKKLDTILKVVKVVKAVIDVAVDVLDDGKRNNSNKNHHGQRH